MHPKPTRPASIKLFAVLSASFLLAFAVGTRQIDVPWTDTPLGILRTECRQAFNQRDYERSAEVARRGLAGASSRVGEVDALSVRSDGVVGAVGCEHAASPRAMLANTAMVLRFIGRSRWVSAIDISTGLP